MNRKCMLCQKLYRYDKVKIVAKTGLQLCNYCKDTLINIVRDDIDYYGL